VNDLKIRIHSDDPRLKRHINHDARSALYAKDVTGLAVESVEWKCHLMQTLDQGLIGSCTAQSADEVLASDPFLATLPLPVVQQVISGTQDWPLAFYHDETVADSYPGTYPPDDTGSDGLTAAKVAVKRRLASGYQHTFTAEAALRGLSTGPALWGTNWMTGMDDVDEATGQVTYTGTVRGGHELSLYKVEAAAERLWFRNHWGAWGYQQTGVAWISFEDFAKSLADQGDVTWLVPLSSPAPGPTPVPQTADAALVAAGDAWEKTILSRITKAGRMRTAFDAWKAEHGY
jgi:hypothetical protein